jgi:predicted RNase H-like HicB family nuclease
MTAYPIDVHWSDEDDAWIADVPDLPFCTAHGPTPHEAVEQVEIAMKAWIGAAEERGQPLPPASVRAARA